MNWTQHLQRLIGVVIVVITCLFASPSAFAHAGHDPADRPSVSSDGAPVIDLVVPPEADRSGVASVEVKAEVSPALPASQSKCCTGGCCTSSHGCCVVNLPIYSGTSCGPDNGAVRAFIEPSLTDGLDPEALRKPPRSFA